MCASAIRIRCKFYCYMYIFMPTYVHFFPVYFSSIAAMFVKLIDILFVN